MPDSKSSPDSGSRRKAYATPLVRAFGSLSELTRSATNSTSAVLDNTTRTKTNHS